MHPLLLIAGAVGLIYVTRRILDKPVPMERKKEHEAISRWEDEGGSPAGAVAATSSRPAGEPDAANQTHRNPA